MSTFNEQIADKIDAFVDIQEYMVSSKKEGATETYNLLKKKYKKLKATLNALGVNLSELDEIKE